MSWTRPFPWRTDSRVQYIVVEIFGDLSLKQQWKSTGYDLISTAAFPTAGRSVGVVEFSSLPIVFCEHVSAVPIPKGAVSAPPDSN